MTLPLEDLVFTKREMEVLACLLGRHSSKKIAEILSINPKTVSTHIYNIMDKLGCHSRERVIEYIEQSALFAPLKNHYFSLIVQAEMHQTLKKICRSNQSNDLCLITQQGHIDENIIHKIQEDLKMAGIKTCFEPRRDQSITHIICVMDVCSIKEKYYNELFKNFNKFLKNDAVPAEAFTFLVHTPICLDFKEKLPYILCGYSYPILLFNFLKRLNLTDFAQGLADKFLQKWKNALTEDVDVVDLEDLRHCGTKEKIIKKTVFFSLKSWWLLLIFIGLCSILTLFHWEKYVSHCPIYSDFSLPHHEILLVRPQLLDGIKQKYLHKQDIQSVVLIGIGGTGKTTLAHQYAQMQNNPLVWEIHAENPERIKESFINLADVLAKNSSDKNELENIKNINNNQEKNKRLAHFIRQKFHSMQPWFLLFDNVENFSDIQLFFPSDVSVWGKGQILMTTRNKHIKNNPYINSQQIVEVKPLTENEKLNLFLQIIKINKNNPNNNVHRINKFLFYIPSFPLDICVAAHYLKNQDISFEDYLKCLQQGSLNIDHMQMDLLSEIGAYTKTRYSIITSVLNKLLDTNKDFVSLILLVSLIGSDGIPKDLLIDCENQTLVDQFIHHMRKHSLMSYERGKNIANQSSLCIHRSTQEVMLVFLNHVLDSYYKKYYVDIIIKKIEKHLDSVLDRTHTVRMQNLIRHLVQLLKKDQLLNKHQKMLIKIQLGRLHYHLGDYLKAQPYFEKGLQYLQSMPHKDFFQIAKILAALGSVERGVGNPHESKDLLEQSLKTYQQHCPDDVINLAWACLQLGVTYTRLGYYEKSEELIQKSLNLYTNAYGKKHEKIAACLINWGTLHRVCGRWTQAEELYKKGLGIYQELGDKDCSSAKACLGTIAKRLGRYKEAVEYLEEATFINVQSPPVGGDILPFNMTLLGDAYQSIGFFKKARETLEHAFKMRTDCYGENNLLSTQTRVHLAKILIDMKEYVLAKKLLEYSFKIYQKYFDEHHIRRGWVSYYLSKVYRNLGHYQQAKFFLDYSFKVYEKHYGKTHLQTARIIRDYGVLYTLTGDYTQAEKHLNQAAALFENENHPELYLCLECLSDLYVSKSLINFDKKSSKFYKNLAKDKLTKAYKLAQKSFPSQSVHLARLRAKAKSI